MEAHNIEYVKLNEMLNEYAIDKLYDILERYGANINKETFEELENRILDNRIISVDHPSLDDNKFFNNNIPLAHGPRTKNDGLIHIYPYTRCKNVTDTQELFNKIIESGIITHELFHFIIKLDDKNITDQEEDEFTHYITEGMVQLYTEEHEKKEFTNSEYRKNVILAKKLRSMIPQGCATKTIFKNNYTNIHKMYPETEEIYEQYKKEKYFLTRFINILKEIEEIIGISHQDLYRRYKRYTIEETIKIFNEQVDTFIIDFDDKEYFKTTINKSYQELSTKKEKRL